MKRIIAVVGLTLGLLLPSVATAQSQPFVFKFGNSVYAYLTNANDRVLIYGTNQSNGQIKVDITGHDAYSFSSWNVDHVFVAAYGGNDRITIGFGMENFGVTVWGGSGDDSIVGGSAAFGQFDGESGRDNIRGTNGADSIFGGEGRDILYGYDGDDYLDGEGDNDLVYGNQGNDEVRGGAGKDSIYGDHGDDLLKPGSGEAEGNVYGGLGKDTFCVLRNFYGQWISLTGHDYSKGDFLHSVN